MSVKMVETVGASETQKHVDAPLALMRTIKDPIHDFITFPAYIWSFIDTRQFQRLRAIKQLGVSYYVWAGASHNRFEHCIGVAHLAGMLVERLRTMQPELGITERDIRCVQLAGLCHDLGHGPWSHVWDGHFIPAVLPDHAWTHEDASEMMFDDLVKQNNIPIDQDDVNFIKDLIKGTVRHSARKEPPEKKFLFDIVANKRNGIDVDKFDYIARDVRAIGDHNNFSARRLIDSARVIDNEICYHIKDANQVYELCTLRFSNHKRIYSHKTAQAIEHMIVDGLKAAEPTMKIAKRILDPAKYVHLTDNVMERIEMSEDPALEESRRIFDRIRKRDLYRCVDWSTFHYDQLTSLREGITPERIVHTAKTSFHSSRSGHSGSEPNQEILASLTPDDVIVDLSTLHFGMKEKNPIDFVRFYGKHNIHESFKAEAGELTTLMPACFAEVQLRVFVKESIYYGIVQAGYRELYLQLQEGGDSPPYLNLAGSPSPPPTEPPLTPRVGRARTSAQSQSLSRSPSLGRSIFSGRSNKTPSLNKFTRVDPSFAPVSPSLSARRRGVSVPPPVSLEARRSLAPSSKENGSASIVFKGVTSEESRETARLIEAGAKKLARLYTKYVAETSIGMPPTRTLIDNNPNAVSISSLAMGGEDRRKAGAGDGHSLVVQDSLASIASEATEVTEARTLVDGRGRLGKLGSPQNGSTRKNESREDDVLTDAEDPKTPTNKKHKSKLSWSPEIDGDLSEVLFSRTLKESESPKASEVGRAEEINMEVDGNKPPTLNPNPNPKSKSKQKTWRTDPESESTPSSQTLGPSPDMPGDKTPRRSRRRRSAENDGGVGDGADNTNVGNSATAAGDENIRLKRRKT